MDTSISEEGWYLLERDKATELAPGGLLDTVCLEFQL